MKKITSILFILILSGSLAQAQYYQTGIGVRGGFFSGISVKHFVSEQDAFEGVLATHYRGILLAGMYQRHAQAFDVPSLNWYYGGGGYMGFYDRGNVPWFDNGYDGAFTTLGFMGVLGLEYKIEEIPIIIGLDVKPAFNLFGHTGAWFAGGATIRYTFD